MIAYNLLGYIRNERMMPMTTFQCHVPIHFIEGRRIVVLPSEISQDLPSKGMVMASITIGELTFTAPLEPDGKFSHWFLLPDAVEDSAPLDVNFSVVNDWPEPEVPEDIWEGLVAFGLDGVWQTLTTKSKWSWIRWIRATNNPETRQKRIGVAADKLLKGNRRPCCFDQTRCTVPELAKGGVLKL